ncbi:hypothetical protein IGB42_01903 [Andreprevotia sp. IGB-42]|uniref:hypothetical protein n=1 Tax=Andreprevotia sp. IGB-42 TaxID=2497473 RepID=UPI0013582670|nr:hypothetical protein [Andreprevotia sp. IGB-42]KAF0813552.1 hypothetical protein IGB42_01903 [Andreprevotia sp. IGB-42]
MQGTISHINPQSNLIAVLTDEREYSIFELVNGDEIETGDEVSWNGDAPMGSEIVTNHTQSALIEVYFCDHHLQASQLRSQLF